MNRRSNASLIILAISLLSMMGFACSQFLTRGEIVQTPLLSARMIEKISTPQAAGTPTLQVAEVQTSTTTESRVPSATIIPPVKIPQVSPPESPNTIGCLVTLFDDVSESATVVMGPSSGVPASPADGEQLVIIGTVFDRACNPLPGASLNVWQTDADGVYGPGHGSESLECCYFQGQVITDEHGRYKLVTVIPGHYAGEDPAPPAHIHMEVSHPQAGQQMTEIVFAGDPSLEAANHADYIIVALKDAGNPDQGNVYKLGYADVRLARGSSITPEPEIGGIRTFQIDPKRSQAAYHIREKFNRLPIQISATGVSSLVEGDIEINLDDSNVLQSIDARVDLRELRSDDPKRDEKLYDDWLEIIRFHHASFTGTRIDGFPEDFTADGEVSFRLWGDLTIRDVTREVPFEVNARLIEKVLTGTATTRIKMSDFGIEPPNMLDFVVVDDEVELTVNIVAVEY